MTDTVLRNRQAHHHVGMTATLPAEAIQSTPSEARPKDPRVKALERFALSITAFNIVGQLLLGFEQSPITPVLVALWAYAVELTLEGITALLHRRRPRFATSWRALYEFLLPTQISAMAVAMLLFAGPVLWPYLFAVTIALASKYIVKAPVKGRWRHTLNPSNCGIAVTLLLFPWVGIAPPYQFTANVGEPWDWLIPLAIAVSGLALNLQLTRRGPLIGAWLATFAGQAVFRWLVLHSTVAPLEPMTGVAFVLFTLYMVTDPGTTPMSRKGQVMYGAGCALIYGLLVELGVGYTLFFSVIVIGLIRTVFLWSAHYRTARLREGES